MKTSGVGIIGRILAALEARGIDCSRQSNEDDAAVLILLAGTAATFGALAVSPFLAGSVFGMLTLKGLQWTRSRRAWRKGSTSEKESV